MKKGRVVSKWGLGHLWEHNILEVPISYGNEYKYYKDIQKEEAINSFCKFAESKGIDLTTLG